MFERGILCYLLRDWGLPSEHLPLQKKLMEVFVAVELVLVSSEDLRVCLEGISYIAGNLWFLKQTKKRTRKSQYIYPTGYAVRVFQR